MQKNLFSITFMKSVIILFLAFSINGNAQVLNAETTANSNIFNPMPPINFNPYQFSYTQPDPGTAPDGVLSLLYDNGSVFNIAGPPPISMLQNTSLGLDTYGFGAQISADNRMADDFTVESDVIIDSFDFYTYQTGASGVSITTIYVQIYDGQPNEGGNVIWGDLTTNVLGNVEMTGGYRQLESAPGDTSRAIQKVTAETEGLVLEAGTYWVEYTFGGTGASGPWAPPITITGVDTTGNAIQYQAGTYLNAVDGVTQTPQGMPFQIYGEEGEMDDCEGTPEAGIITGPESICSGIGFTLKAEGASSGVSGLTRQWQSSPAGENDWSDIPDATSSTYFVGEGIDASTDYRFVITCTISGESAMAEHTVNLNEPNECYCTPTITIAVEPISKVIVAGIDNSSDPNSALQYEDFTSIEGNMAPGGSYDAAFEGNTAGNFTTYFTVFIDWNQNGILNDEGEVYPIGSITNSTGSDGQQAIGTIEVPTNALSGNTRMRVIKNFNTSPTDPCGSYGYGQIEDYTINVGELEDCTGTPDGGTASVNPESGNMGSTYTVTATGYSYGLGMSYQWQSNTDDAGWVDEGDATENYASYTATAPDILGVEVAWRLAITCTLSGETSYSETAVFTTVITYCQPSFSSSSDYIVSFVLENIQNTDSGFSPGGYGDFTSMSTVLASPSYEATLTSSSGSGNHGAAIWIDANDNGTFELSERVGFLSNIGASQTVQIPISIAGVATGEHRMRVVYQYNVAGDTIDPCVSASFGEAEDYTVIIGELDDCTGTPDPGTVSVNPESGNPGITYIVSSTGYTYGNGLSYQWQSNLNDTGWVDEGEASEFYSNYTATAPGELNDTVDWRLVLTCNNSGESATSNVATFVVDRLHCTPEGTNAARYINDFTTTDGLENISNLNSGFSPGGYGDFYNDYQIVQVPGQEVSFNAVFEGGTFGFRIWVDWNEDGTFSADEVMYASSSYISSQNGTFQVPTNATPGEKRMRIVNHWLSATGDIDPCATGFTYGEFEDYKFVVGELEDCEGTPNGGNITITPSEGNPDSIYTVSASGYSYGNGLSYQWQSNTDGNGWVDEGEATDYYMDYTATAPGVVGINVEWRLQVTCTLSGESSFSDTATFTTTIVYCVPSFSSTSDFIQSFELEEIQNINSGFSPGGYGDFTAMSTMLTNPEHTASLTSSSGSGSHGAAIWIDFNDNGTFEDAERVGFASGIQPNQTVDITMDLADAIPGEHRMRIIYQWNVAGDIINPCVSASFGEAEDYTVIIGEPEPCEGTPEAGTVSVDPAFGNPGSTYTVKSSGYSFALDLTFQWQSNTEDAGWVNEGELLTQYAHHLATAPTQPNVSVDWRLIVTCLNSGETTTSNEATFTTVMPGCGHETPSNNLEDAHGNLHLLEIANDFVVNVNQRFLVDVAEINLVIPTGVPVDAADFRFYADTGNGPGEEVVSNLAVAPTSVTVIMNTGGFTLAKYLFNLEGIVLDGNDTTETVYWMGVSIDANVSASYWEVTSTINSDNEEYIYLDGMWQTSTEVFQEPMDGVMKLQGSCETLPTNDLLAFDFAYYPNPVRDVLNITSKAGIQSVTAYNLAGQQVLNLNGDKLNSGQIDVTTLPQGVYVFRTILEGGQVETFKIVKK